ncbi:MAG: DivIVA domain-containing protein [Actinomycetota bacterium]|nr:DivIVA domain-containing protein [Actinomycetota bacterium]
MKLTPLDIHHKEFRRALRGYNEEEVDTFLDEVAEEFERVFKENIELKEKLEQIEGKLRQYENIEQTLQKTLVTAQSSAEEIQSNAKKQAELIIKDAELKAKEIVQEVLREKQELQATYGNLRQIKEEFLMKFRSMLESYLSMVSEAEAAKEKEMPEEVAGVEEKEEVTAETVEPVEELVLEEAVGEEEAPTEEPAPVIGEEPEEARKPLEEMGEEGFSSFFEGSEDESVEGAEEKSEEEATPKEGGDTDTAPADLSAKDENETGDIEEIS